MKMDKVENPQKVEYPQDVIFSVFGMSSILVIEDEKILTPKWTDIDCDKVITLKEISDQFPNSCLLVIAETPLDGAIYRYNNYSDNSWYKVGTMCGYA